MILYLWESAVTLLIKNTLCFTSFKLSPLWANSADDNLTIFFSYFSQKTGLTFHANCLLRRQFAWNIRSCSLGRIRKIFQNVVCWNYYSACFVLRFQFKAITEVWKRRWCHLIQNFMEFKPPPPPPTLRYWHHPVQENSDNAVGYFS